MVGRDSPHRRDRRDRRDGRYGTPGDGDGLAPGDDPPAADDLPAAAPTAGAPLGSPGMV